MSTKNNDILLQSLKLQLKNKLNILLTCISENKHIPPHNKKYTSTINTVLELKNQFLKADLIDLFNNEIQNFIIDNPTINIPTITPANIPADIQANTPADIQANKLILQKKRPCNINKQKCLQTNTTFTLDEEATSILQNAIYISGLSANKILNDLLDTCYDGDNGTFGLDFKKQTLPKEAAFSIRTCNPYLKTIQKICKKYNLKQKQVISRLVKEKLQIKGD